jgi:DNA-binding NarL/FixJ family response regulator
MPVMNGILATRTILSSQPSIKIIAMTGLADTDVVQSMLRAGAVGYVLKESEPHELESIIRMVFSGTSVFSAGVMGKLLNPKGSAPDYGLSPREQQVLALIAGGQTNAQIALALGISQPTVRFHFNNILEKLGVETRSEALVLAGRLGLV